MANITLSVTTSPNTLTLSGVKSLGAPADLVAIATPTGGTPIPLGTLPAQPDGPYTLSAMVPPGSYTVQVTSGAVLSSDTTVSCIVPPAMLVITGNNTLGYPATVTLTATPTGGGTPIPIGTLTNQPVGPFAVTASLPPGDYTIDTAMTATITSDTQASASVPPPVLSLAGNNTLGISADVVVTATPSGGGSPIVSTLANQPPGPFSVIADAAPGDYAVDIALTGTLTSDVQNESTVLPTVLSAAGNNTLGVPADVVVTATPVGGGSPITVANLSGQPVGAYSVAADVPAGSYTVDMLATASVSTAATATATVPAPDIVATISYKGSSYSFAKSTGTSLGDYSDPQGRFVHDCVQVTNSGLPSFTVFFRSDKQPGASRDEVIFEYGDIWKTASPSNMTGYTASIAKGDVALATISVPQHYFRARWRWQSAPRPATAAISDLIAGGLLPHYDASVLGKYSKDTPAYTYTPITLAGISPMMGQTGERPDIGPVTGWQADYICAGTNLSTVLAQAEAAGTLYWHYRDESTGAPLDVFAYPKASTYPGSGAVPFIPTAACTIGGTPLQIDPGHEPSLAYLPFLLTGDSYYLEELQFNVTSDILGLPYSGRFAQYGRYLAWPLRNAFHAAKVTPATVPSWLKPQSYFQTVLNSYLAWVTSCVNNTTDPVKSVLHAISSGGSQSTPGAPAGSYFDGWQESFISLVIGWGVQLGFTEWTDALVWKIDSDVQRTNGTSGWRRSNPTPYSANFCSAAGLTAAVGMADAAIQLDNPNQFANSGSCTITIDAESMLATAGLGTTTWTVQRGCNNTKAAAHPSGHPIYGPKVTSWAACMSLNYAAFPSSYPTMQGDTSGMNQLYTATSGSVTYPSYTRGALAMAARLGVAAAASSFAWLDGQMTAALSSAYQMDRKWMIT